MIQLGHEVLVAVIRVGWRWGGGLTTIPRKNDCCRMDRRAGVRGGRQKDGAGSVEMCDE